MVKERISDKSFDSDLALDHPLSKSIRIILNQLAELRVQVAEVRSALTGDEALGNIGIIRRLISLEDKVRSHDVKLIIVCVTASSIGIALSYLFKMLKASIVFTQ